MNDKHKRKCTCALCESGDSKGDRIAMITEFEERCMRQFGWFAHVIMDSDNVTGFSFHTHGLEISQKHKDFEITLPIGQETAHGIMTSIADRIKAGEKFEEGKDYDGIIVGFKVRFVERTETRRQVLRVILPDKDGNLDRDKVKDDFAKQWE